MKHIKALDTIRALAVIFVIKQHWGFPIEGNPNEGYKHFFEAIIPNGADGVYIFFVLSGFLISSILLQAREENSTTKDRLIAIKNFVVRRGLRIFPIYYLMVVILYYASPETKEYLLYILTYTINIAFYQCNCFASPFGHSWTLAVEEQFYLFWPWLVLFLNRKYLKYLFIAAIAVGIGFTFINQGLYTAHNLEPFLVFSCLDAFGLGALYAYMRLDKTRCLKFEKIIKILAPICLAIFVTWKITGYAYHVEYAVWLSKTVVSILSLWLIMKGIHAPDGRLKKYFWENRYLNFIGAISYGIYLYHPYMSRMNYYVVPFINDRIVHNPVWHDILVSYQFLYWLNFAVLILLCWLSYNLIEKPLLKLKRFFNYTQQKQLTPIEMDSSTQSIAAGKNN